MKSGQFDGVRLRINIDFIYLLAITPASISDSVVDVIITDAAGETSTIHPRLIPRQGHLHRAFQAARARHDVASGVDPISAVVATKPGATTGWGLPIVATRGVLPAS